ncbi:ATP-binding cassette domain-containing protein [Gordonia alkaliphila]|uniref:ATP-binding cassette domain-containing protein n=1 Tax=Gordonia alkaliphila TaxID=1053547 RepID=UPI001FF37636|nr:ATP-binding cassette domain-containing protein [Gordonia alkaliphila]MCK0438400.1 ATP-binding cassette domain-containing protein [Gordonia alkaliphila]
MTDRDQSPTAGTPARAAFDQDAAAVKPAEPDDSVPTRSRSAGAHRLERSSREVAKPWVPSDDPTLAQLRAWRSELDSETGGSARAERAGGHRLTRNAEREELSRWVIPGSARPRAMPEPLVEERAPTVRRMPAPERIGWDIATAAVANPPAPIGSQAEFEATQVETTSFAALDAVPIPPAEDLEVAIEARGLRKEFKGFTAVDDVSLRVHKGRIVALLGPNGAGKTTTVNMLTTLLKPDSGTASVAGYDVVHEAPAVRRAITLTGQFAALDEQLSGRENLVMFARLLGLSKKAARARAAELLESFGLVAAAEKKVREYSGGMRRRIDIACGMVTMPEVVFLDEPTTGLDPRSRQDVWAFVEELRSQGVTILLTTQYLEEADVLADRIVVIDKGKVIAEGTSDELKAATGAAYCEVTPVHPAYVPRLRAALSDLLGSAASDEAAPDGTLSVPAPNGPETLAEVLRRTERAQIPLSDVMLRRPSLDEVFLSLTEPRNKDAEGAVEEGSR